MCSIFEAKIVQSREDPTHGGSGENEGRKEGARAGNSSSFHL